MAGLYTAMVGDDADEAVGDLAPTDADAEDEQVQRASVFLTRVLFLLYGDDAGLWEEDLFHRFVLYDTTPDNLGAQLSALFGVLNSRIRRHVPLQGVGEVPVRERRPVRRPDAGAVFHPSDAGCAAGSVPVPVDPHQPGGVRVDVPDGEVA